jgi:enoyl-CoA hydratase
VLQATTDGPVARLILNRPRKANALSGELLAALDAALADVASDRSVKVVLLEGAGTGFSAGYDIEPGGAVEGSKADIVADWLRLRGNAERWMRLWRFPKPIVAKVHGYCIAGGLELATACDLVVAAEGTRFGYPAVRGVGVPPFMMLPFLVNARVVRQMLFTGDSVYGQEAVDIGLANRVVPLEELEDTARGLAERIALMPLEQLILGKASLLRTYEIMGVGPAALSGVEFDSISHFGPAVQDFWNRSREHGVREAVRVRDEPFDGGSSGVPV